MQFSASHLSPDPSFAALLFPAAVTAPAAAPASAATPSTGDFDALFAELAPAPETATNESPAAESLAAFDPAALGIGSTPYLPPTLNGSWADARCAADAVPASAATREGAAEEVGEATECPAILGKTDGMGEHRRGIFPVAAPTSLHSTDALTMETAAGAALNTLAAPQPVLPNGELCTNPDVPEGGARLGGIRLVITDLPDATPNVGAAAVTPLGPDAKPSPTIGDAAAAWRMAADGNWRGVAREPAASVGMPSANAVDLDVPVTDLGREELTMPATRPAVSPRDILPAAQAGYLESSRSGEVKSAAPSSFRATEPNVNVAAVGRNEEQSMGQENFAGNSGRNFQSFGTSPNANEKSFLTAKAKSLASHVATIGTGGAQAAGPMVAHSNSVVLPNPTSEYVGTDAFTADVASPTEAVPELSTAHRAVEAVLKSVEEVAARDQKTVMLRFSVAGEELNVRVELREDQVRTTFRTDSAELRAALSQEWQVVGTAGERGARLAPPVFTANDASLQNSFAGDTSSRHRDAQGRRGEDHNGEAFGRDRGVTRTSASPRVESRAGTSAPATSLHLHTLA